MTTHQGSIALITGGNQGIGFETGRGLGRLGMTVLLGSRDLARGEEAAAQLRAEDIDARAVQLDVTDDASVTAAARWVDDTYGHLDVLVNNAGTPSVKGGRTTPETTTVEDMKAVYEVNVFGVVRVTNAFLPLMRRSQHPRIVNVSSEVGSIGAKTSPTSKMSSLPASVQYPTSKAALNMMTVQYAVFLRDEGFLVNATNPGWTATNFGGNRSGIRTPEQGAEPSIHLATLPDDGPTGTFWGHLWTTDGDGDGGYGILPW